MNTWYVSKSGNDNNMGSISSPYLTIQKAVNSAIAGDSIIVDAGVYRETVTFTRSGTATATITLQSVVGANVVISGAEILSGWTPVNGSIYQASLSWDLGVGMNQLFVDGVAVTESRWPYPGTDISRPVKATVKSVTFTSDTQGQIVDPSLTQPDGYWNGCPIHIMGGEEWICSYGTVTSYTVGKFNFTSVNPDTGSFFQTFERLKPGNHYYLFGKAFPTQNAGQWFLSAGQMQLWTPLSDNPTNHVVEVKKRQLAINFGNSSYITVKGIQTFAGAITSSSSSTHLIVDGVNAKYTSQFVLFSQWWVPNDSGICFNGTNCVVQNSIVEYSAGDGIFLGGGSNTALNNIVYDTNYSACGGAAIHTWGNGHLIQHNSILRSGRCGVNHQASSQIKILNNDIGNTMLQTTDGGGIYTYGQDGKNSEVAYNRVYGQHSGGYHAVGIYFDNGSHNFNCHHNLTFDCDIALKLNSPSNNNTITNNTFDATLLGIDFDKPDMGGCVLTNNIFTKKATIAPNATQSNNIFQGTDPQFVDAVNLNYALQATTTHPIVGCFPVGMTVWTAGATTVSPSPIPPPTPVPPVVVPALATTLFDATKYTSASSQIKLVPQASENLGAPTSVGFTNIGEWIKYANIDFGTGVTMFAAAIAVMPAWAGQTMEIHLDSITGPLIGKLIPQSTGAWYNYMAEVTTVSGASGVHDLYFLFKGTIGGVANIKSFTFGR